MDNSLTNDENQSSIESIDESMFIKCETLRIHSNSDIFEPSENYVGLIDFGTGDIFIKQSDWIMQNIPQRQQQQHNGTYLHGRLFYWIFKQWKIPKNEFVGRGFSYLDGQWKFHSKTLNNNHHHHPNEFEQKLLEVILDNLYVTHRWMELPPNYRFSCRDLITLERNKKSTSMLHPSDVHVNRKLHGTVKWLTDQHRRLGLIQCLGFDRDFSIHSMALPNSLSYSGKNIEFNIVEEANQWKIKNVALIWP